MDDYTLTEAGRDFILRALAVCIGLEISWTQLWTSRSAKARTARRLLDLGKCNERTGKVLGATAVADLISRFMHSSDFSRIVAMLGKVDLLNTANITIAAEAFGISDQSLWNLLSPGEVG
jgi:hypothetical protein